MYDNDDFNAESILSDVTIEEALKGVIAALPEDNIDPDSDQDSDQDQNPDFECDIEDLNGIQLGNSLNNDDKHKTKAIISSEKAAALSNTISDNSTKSAALSIYNSERSLVAFMSPAADYFNGREFQGLIPIVPEGQNTDIQRGHIGIAKSYKRYEKTNICTPSNDK